MARPRTPRRPPRHRRSLPWGNTAARLLEASKWLHAARLCLQSIRISGPESSIARIGLYALMVPAWLILVALEIAAAATAHRLHLADLADLKKAAGNRQRLKVSQVPFRARFNPRPRKSD